VTGIDAEGRAAGAAGAAGAAPGQAESAVAPALAWSDGRPPPHLAPGHNTGQVGLPHAAWAPRARAARCDAARWSIASPWHRSPDADFMSLC
jgi:hypothetical protein